MILVPQLGSPRFTTDFSSMRVPATPPKRSLAVRELIEERIADGRYPPGMRLDEVALAKEFGVSRTPVRETLIQLSSSGMVDLRPRRGAVVADASPHRICEMFEVMAELEAMCGRLAARRITDQEQADLMKTHRACERARDEGSADAYFIENEAFHQVIYGAAHNAFLAEQAGQLQRRLRPFRRLQLRIRNRVGTSFAEHQAIVDALVAGDGDKAAQALRQHVIVQGERYGDLVASITHMKSVAREPGPAPRPKAPKRPAAGRRVRT
jgi:DNA-binding GntR family transcriptional regulator